MSECPAAESASGTAWRRSSANRRWWFCSSGTGAEWSTFRPDGGFITAVNHNSYLDPLSYAHFQYNTGRVPRFLAKAALFKGGFVGADAARHRADPRLPRDHRRARRLPGRRRRRRAGECVAFYPEGTLTRDPDHVADDRQDRRRAGRAAHQGPGHPGRPVGRQPGDAAVRQGEEAPALPAQDPQGAGRPAGRPVARSTARSRRPRCSGRPPTVIMAAVTDLLAELRGEQAPARARPATTSTRQPTAGSAAQGRQEEEHQVTRVAPSSAPAPGAPPSRMVLADAGLRGHAVGPPARASSRPSTPRRTNPDYLPGVELPDGVRATTDAAEAAARRGVHRARRALADAARQPRRLGAAAARRTPCSSP